MQSSYSFCSSAGWQRKMGQKTNEWICVMGLLCRVAGNQSMTRTRAKHVERHAVQIDTNAPKIWVSKSPQEWTSPTATNCQNNVYKNFKPEEKELFFFLFFLFFHERCKNFPGHLDNLCSDFLASSDDDLGNESFLIWSTPHTHLAWCILVSLWCSEPAFHACFSVCKWCSSLGHRSGSLRTPSSVGASQSPGLHGWLNTEEHSGPPVSQHERLTHNEAYLICMSFITIQIVFSSRGVAPSLRWVLSMLCSGFVAYIHIIIPTAAKPVCVFDKAGSSHFCLPQFVHLVLIYMIICHEIV